MWKMLHIYVWLEILTQRKTRNEMMNDWKHMWESFQF